MINVIFSELSSPVSIIKSQILLLHKQCNDSKFPLLGETLTFCEDSIESIQGFIEKINFLYSSQNCAVMLKPEWASLRLLINQVFTELRHQKLDINRIRFNCSVEDFIVIPDKCLFIRILVNLLSNALKFSKEKVELFISKSGNNRTIVVRDSGIGILWNQIPEIFNPFVRGDNVNKIKGTGLGLSFVTNAVKSLNGNITLHSELGKGTEFRIVLPYNETLDDSIRPTQIKQLSDHLNVNESEYSQFIGSISHELRTPISILKSNIQLLKTLRFEFDKGLKDETINICEASLQDIERFFDNIGLLNILITPGVNVAIPDSCLSNLHVN